MLHCRNVVNGETLSISRLIELAGDLGLKAEHARLDWQRLQALGFGRPILALLKSTNVIILTGGGRGGAPEVAVWDPLDPYRETLFVPRADFERAWTGHTLIITPPQSNGVGTSSCLDFCWFTSAGLELLGKTSAGGQNSKLLVRGRKDAGTSRKLTAPRMPRRTDRALASATRGEPAHVRPEIGNEPLPPDPAANPRLSSPALSRLRSEPGLSRLVRFGIAAGAVLAAAGIGTFLLSNSGIDPVSAAITLAKEVWAAAPHRLQSTDQAMENVTGRTIQSFPRTGSVPIPAPLSATPAAEPDVAVPSAAPAAVPRPAASPSAPSAVPGLVAPSDEPTAPPVEPAAPILATAPTAPPGEPDVVSPSAEPSLTTPGRAPDTTTAAPPPSTSGSRLSAEEEAALLARGDTLLSVGDIASARLFYERAVDAGGGLAAIRLGETFDPLFLDRVHLSGVRGDPDAALFWYRRARELGAAHAGVLLKALEAKKE
ncbi:MAG: hypothetical protein JO282_02715 [Alphaproteobacteria bacterium]|nr:hypothetical protein [Alphaproteobacteria bacterium]